MHWLGYSAEVTVHRPDSVSRLRSVHLAVSLGAPTLNATYVPVEIRTVLFPGQSHLEVAAGVSIQVAYSDRMLDATFQDVPSYGFVPGASLAYRYESDDGGFFFRLGLGTLFYYRDNLGQGFVTQTVGFSF